MFEHSCEEGAEKIGTLRRGHCSKIRSGMEFGTPLAIEIQTGLMRLVGQKKEMVRFLGLGLIMYS